MLLWDSFDEGSPDSHQDYDSVRSSARWWQQLLTKVIQPGHGRTSRHSIAAMWKEFRVIMSPFVSFDCDWIWCCLPVWPSTTTHFRCHAWLSCRWTSFAVISWSTSHTSETRRKNWGCSGMQSGASHSGPFESLYACTVPVPVRGWVSKKKY